MFYNRKYYTITQSIDTQNIIRTIKYIWINIPNYVFKLTIINVHDFHTYSNIIYIYSLIKHVNTYNWYWKPLYITVYFSFYDGPWNFFILYNIHFIIFLWNLQKFYACTIRCRSARRYSEINNNSKKITWSRYYYEKMFLANILIQQ